VKRKKVKETEKKSKKKRIGAICQPFITQAFGKQYVGT
jgi:hypothetical protein